MRLTPHFSFSQLLYANHSPISWYSSVVSMWCATHLYKKAAFLFASQIHHLAFCTGECYLSLLSPQSSRSCASSAVISLHFHIDIASKFCLEQILSAVFCAQPFNKNPGLKTVSQRILLLASLQPDPYLCSSTCFYLPFSQQHTQFAVHLVSTLPVWAHLPDGV